jgi:hypothetical protein
MSHSFNVKNKRRMFVSIESDDLIQAIELGTQYMAYLCEEGNPFPLLLQGDMFQTFTSKALEGSPYIKEALVHSKQLDFMANSTMAAKRLADSGGLVYVNYVSYSAGDYRFHNRGPMPSVIFHIVTDPAKMINDGLRQFCGMHGINYVPIDSGQSPDIRMMFVYVHTTKVGNHRRMTLTQQTPDPVPSAAVLTGSDELEAALV